jgi:hypothetical protein
VKSAKNNYFSGQLTVFHGRRLPEIATLAGYSALIDAFELNTPLPRTLAATSDHHQTRRENSWQILTARHAPEPTLESHLTFALKYEGLDLAVLSKLFKKIGPACCGNCPIDANGKVRQANMVFIRVADKFIARHTGCFVRYLRPCSQYRQAVCDLRNKRDAPARQEQSARAQRILPDGI